MKRVFISAMEVLGEVDVKDDVDSVEVHNTEETSKDLFRSSELVPSKFKIDSVADKHSNVCCNRRMFI